MSYCKNKVVVITGGNSGIGKAIASKFDLEGAKTVIFGRDKSKLHETQEKLNNAITIQGDIRNMTDLSTLFKTTENELGKIDVLIANAGVGTRRHVNEVDEIFFDEIVDINFKGTYFTVQKSIPFLNDGAYVILISSIAAHIGWQEH